MAVPAATSRASHDWLDNGFQRSPHRLVEGLAPVAVGDPFMGWNRVVDVDAPRCVTFLCRSYAELEVPYGGRNWFANVAQKPGYRLFHLDWVGGSYRIEPVGPRETRLLVRPLSELLFELADFVMMRRQLLNLKGLAEGAAAERCGRAAELQ